MGIKFSFGAKPKAPIQNFVELVRLGEGLGFDAAWVPDQTFFPDPFLSIAMSAAATETIDLVIGVVNPFTRHPVQVARAAATLDDIAPGRIVLGYGAGNRKELIAPMGYEQKQSTQRCREAILVSRQLLQGETVNYRSETLVADGIQLEMPAHPNIPIYLAARGPQILQLAGELADVVVIGALISKAGLEFAIQQAKVGALRAGRKPDEVELMSWITCYVTEDKPAWTQYYRPSAAHILAGAPAEVFEALNLKKDFMDTLKARYAEGGSGAAASLVPDELVHQLAVIGSPDEVAEQLNTATGLGIKHFGILVNAPTITETEQMLRKFAEHVMPAFK